MRTVVLPIVGYLILAAALTVAAVNITRQVRGGRSSSSLTAALAAANLAVAVTADIRPAVRVVDLTVGVLLAGAAFALWLARRG